MIVFCHIIYLIYRVNNFYEYLTILFLLLSIKNGKVVIVLAGRFAGRKAVVVKASEDAAGGKKFGHALGKCTICCIPGMTMLIMVIIKVAGIDRYPRKVVRAMGKKKLEKRSKVKPFVKVLNFNHVLPTRYLMSGFSSFLIFKFVV